MRLTDDDERELSYVYLGLTEPEARELRDALDHVLADPGTANHVHVSDADYAKEVTVWLVDD